MKRFKNAPSGYNEDFNARGLDRQLGMSNRYLTEGEWYRLGLDWLRRHNFDTERYGRYRSEVEVYTYYIDSYGQEREIKGDSREKFKFFKCFFARNHNLVFLVATYNPKYNFDLA